MSSYRVLTINGGGVRGLVPAKILHKLSSVANKNITDLFDYIIGTSVGGIIAVSLTAKGSDGGPKYSTKDVVDIMMDESKIIFPQSSNPLYASIMSKYKPKYDRSGIDDLLETKLGNATLLDTVRPIATVSYSLDTDSPRVWSTFRAERDDSYNYYLKDAAAATSAAPTYFAPKVTTMADGRVFHDVDGGIYANSPTALGLGWLLEEHPELTVHDILVVSIGTGRFADKPANEFVVKAPGSNNNNVFDISQYIMPGVSMATSFINCVTFMKFFPFVAAPVCLASGILGLAGEFIIAQSDLGELGWVTSHNIIDKMMKGAEMADAVSSSLIFKTIRINPKLDDEFSSLDNSGATHMNRFNTAIDRFLINESQLWYDIVDCLNSAHSKSDSCAKLREITSAFNEEFKYTELDQLAIKVMGSEQMENLDKET